jgi:hypothetical protein
LAAIDSVSRSQINEARSEFLLLMGDIRSPNFCKANVVRSQGIKSGVSVCKQSN